MEKEMSKEEVEKGTWDYAYVYTDIYRITGCESLQVFQEKQHLK